MLTLELADRMNWNLLFDVLDQVDKFLCNDDMTPDELDDNIAINAEVTIKDPMADEEKAMAVFLGNEENIKTIVQPDKNVYHGQVLDGLKHGHGKIIYTNGDIFEGKFKNDAMNGKGKIKYKDGHTYVGMFADDKKNGLGKYTWGDTGDSFEGQFVDGKRNGFGKETYANGDYFEGNYVNDRTNGFGCLISLSGYEFHGNHMDDKVFYSYSN